MVVRRGGRGGGREGGEEGRGERESRKERREQKRERREEALAMQLQLLLVASAAAQWETTVGEASTSVLSRSLCLFRLSLIHTRRYGELDGKQGSFPGTYVRIVKAAPVKTLTPVSPWVLCLTIST